MIEALIFLAILGGVVVFVVLPAMREATIRRNEKAVVWMLRDYGRARLLAAKQKLDGRPAAEPALPLRAAGYSFVLAQNKEHWWVDAKPVFPDRSGRRYFYLGSEGVSAVAIGEHVMNIATVARFRLGAPASSADSPVR